MINQLIRKRTIVPIPLENLIEETECLNREIELGRDRPLSSVELIWAVEYVLERQ